MRHYKDHIANLFFEDYSVRKYHIVPSLVLRNIQNLCMHPFSNIRHDICKDKRELDEYYKHYHINLARLPSGQLNGRKRKTYMVAVFTRMKSIKVLRSCPESGGFINKINKTSGTVKYLQSKLHFRGVPRHF